MAESQSAEQNRAPQSELFMVREADAHSGHKPDDGDNPKPARHKSLLSIEAREQRALEKRDGCLQLRSKLINVSQSIDRCLDGGTFIRLAAQFRLMTFQQMAEQFLAHDPFSPRAGGDRVDHAMKMGLKIFQLWVIHTAAPRIPPMTAAN